MPNWTENSLTIKKKDWAKFKEVAWDDVADELTFSKLLPHPLEVRIDEHYNNIFTNNRDEEDKDVPFDDQWFQDKKGEVSVLRKAIKELGLNTEGWYAWNCNHWGTKWDACDSYVDNIDDMDNLDDEDDLVVIFNTAWSAPEPWYQALSEIIPFETECTEEGGFFHFFGYSDGEGDFTINDDTEEYFSSHAEDDDEEE